MGWQLPKLNLRVAQKQILTPGLVQMVSVLALNKLELKEMINQEMVENPVLEELSEDGLPEEEEATAETEEAAGEAEKQEAMEAQAEEIALPEPVAPDAAERQKAASGEEAPAAEPPAETELPEIELGGEAFDAIDFDAFFNEYMGPAEPRSTETEEIEKPSFESFLSSPTTLADHLEWQLSLTVCADAVREAARSIIGNLDEDGYLTATLEEIAQTGGHAMTDVEEALRLVQEFDPLGVASRDLRECLLIQLAALDPDNSVARQIVSEHLKQLQNKQYKEIARTLNRSVNCITAAVEVIKKLDPRPGQRYNKTEARLIEPDVFFVKMGDDYQIIMNEDDLPQLRLSPVYRRMLSRNASNKEVRTFIKERFSSAIQLIKNIEQRKQTIIRVCESIIRRQRDFLDFGIDQLKPMMIKEVAEEVGVHPSTVSRAVANKYSHTPQGVYELRFFFTEAVNGPMGGATSLLILKRKVKKMIEEEEPAHPLTDDHIAKLLEQEGIHVTRRTVAKYREDMRIPSTHQRRVKT